MCADFVAGALLCEPPCVDFVAGTALCEPPYFFEPRRGSSAERRVRDGLGSFSDHARIMLEIVPLRLEVSVVLEAQISWQAQHFVNLHAGEPQFPLLTSDIANFAQRGTHTLC